MNYKIGTLMFFRVGNDVSCGIIVEEVLTNYLGPKIGFKIHWLKSRQTMTYAKFDLDKYMSVAIS